MIKQAQANGESIRIEPQEYTEFSEFLRAACGINLGENKQYLVSTRIRRILLENSMTSLGELTARIKNDRDRILRQRVLDAMTTNETFWFRDTYPYEYLSNHILPELATKKTGKVARIWSAACSTGQEPYSISMKVQESLQNKFGPKAIEADILATDLSSEALDVAKKGSYDKISVVRGLDEKRMKEYFVEEDGGGTWRVCRNLQSRIRFRPLNLQDSFYLLGKFDVIFCRNVLIYFSTDLKNEILTKLHGALNPGGYLFLGSSESITGVNHLFEMINCRPGVVYKAK